MKKKKNKRSKTYKDASAEERCEMLGWRIDLMSTQIVNHTNPYTDGSGKREDYDSLVYYDVHRGKTHSSIGLN